MAKKTKEQPINIADVPLDAGRIHKRDQHIQFVQGLNYRQDAYADIQDNLQNPAPVDLGATAYGNIMRNEIKDYFAVNPTGKTNSYLYRLFDFDKVTFSKAAGISRSYYCNRYWPRVDGSYMELPVTCITFKVFSADARFELRLSWQRILTDYSVFQTPTRKFTLHILLVDTLLNRTAHLGVDTTPILIDSDHDSVAAHTRLFRNLFLEVMHKSNNAASNPLEAFFNRQRRQASSYDVYL